MKKRSGKKKTITSGGYLRSWLCKERRKTLWRAKKHGVYIVKGTYSIAGYIKRVENVVERRKGARRE